MMVQQISPLNEFYPREVAFLWDKEMQRITVFSHEEFVKKVKQSIRLKNTYYSVYAFETTDDGGWRCNYNTAIIDRMFFDFDRLDVVKDSSGKIILKTTQWDNAWRLHLWCMANNITHAIVFSGRGYHVYVFAVQQLLEYPRDAILRASVEICTKAGYDVMIDGATVRVPLNADIIAFGKVDQLARLVGSYNFKAVKTNVSEGYVISVPIEVMKKGHEAVVKYASKNRGFDFLTYGKKTINLDLWDTTDRVSKENFYCWKKNNETSEGFKLSVNAMNVPIQMERAFELFPPCIQTLISVMKVTKLSYGSVLQLSCFLRDCGWSIEEQLEFWFENYIENKGLDFDQFKRNETSWFEYTYGLKRGTRAKGGYRAFNCETSRLKGCCSIAQSPEKDIIEITSMKYKPEYTNNIITNIRKAEYRKACHTIMKGELGEAMDEEKEISHAMEYYETIRRVKFDEVFTNHPISVNVDIPPCVVARLTNGISGYTSRIIVSILYHTGMKLKEINSIMKSIGVDKKIYAKTLKNPITVTCSLMKRQNLCIEPSCAWDNSWNDASFIHSFSVFDRDFIVEAYTPIKDNLLEQFNV